MGSLMKVNSDSLETQTAGPSRHALRTLRIDSVNEIRLRPRLVRFIKRHGSIAEWFRGRNEHRGQSACYYIGIAVAVIFIPLIIVACCALDKDYVAVCLGSSLIAWWSGMSIAESSWNSPDSILGGVGPGMIDDSDVASVSVIHPILGDCMLTWSPENTPDADSNNGYECMRKLFVQGIGHARFYSQEDSAAISDKELTDWLRSAVYDAWTTQDAWRDGRVTIHALENTGEANDTIKQCLELIASITARADALGLSLSDELDPIRETLREYISRDDAQTVEMATVARKNPLTWFDHHASAGSGNDTLSESIGNNIDMDRMIVSLDHAVTVSIPSKHELENDVLPRLRSIDARLEAMSLDTATVRDAAITLSSLDTHLEQVAVAASAR